MPIVVSELLAFGSLSRPEDDVAASGGAPDMNNRPVFQQLLANSTLVVSSSAADTRTVQCRGRDTTGAIVQENLVLNGTTPVSGAQVFERLLTVRMGASGAQTVTVGGSGVGNLGQIPAGEIGFYILFIASASDPSVTRTRYEKFFWFNKNASLTLTAAQITLTADPSTKINVGLSASLMDSLSVSNRLSAPGGVSFVGVGVAQDVPTNQVPAGQGCGVWVRQSLLAGDSAQKNTFTSQLAGNSV